MLAPTLSTLSDLNLRTSVRSMWMSRVSRPPPPAKALRCRRLGDDNDSRATGGATSIARVRWPCRKTETIAWVNKRLLPWQYQAQAPLLMPPFHVLSQRRLS